MFLLKAYEDIEYLIHLFNESLQREYWNKIKLNNFGWEGQCQNLKPNQNIGQKKQTLDPHMRKAHLRIMESELGLVSGAFNPSSPVERRAELCEL